MLPTRKTTALIFFIFLFNLSFAQQLPKPLIPSNIILKDLSKYLAYENKYLKFLDDYTVLSTKGNVISKDLFFKSFSSGNYLPLKLQIINKKEVFQLVKLDDKVDKDIKTSLASRGRDKYITYKMEGTTIKEFNFIDLNRKSYTNLNTKNKYLIIKCWFINCLPCIKEFPQLNALVDKYKLNKNFEFISLALDSEEKLKQFLKKHTFNYKTIANQEKFIEDVLGIKSYPAHIIINKEGKIVKVVNNYNDLEYVLSKIKT
jgi:thiol-disulfide isomerase/thioredoxin